jgi:hypothetical protein
MENEGSGIMWAVENEGIGARGIMWVKEYRNLTGLGLRDSKEAFDRLRALGVDPWLILEVVRPGLGRNNTTIKEALREVLDEWFADQDGKE